MVQDPLESVEQGICDLERELRATRAQLCSLIDRRARWSSRLAVAVISVLLVLGIGHALAATPRSALVLTVLGSSGKAVMGVYDSGAGGWLQIASSSPGQAKRGQPKPFPWVAGLYAGRGGQIGVNDVGANNYAGMYFPGGSKAGTFDIVSRGVVLAQLGPGEKNVMQLRISNVRDRKVAQFGEREDGAGLLDIADADGHLRIHAWVFEETGGMAAMGPKGPVPLWFKGVLTGLP